MFNTKTQNQNLAYKFEKALYTFMKKHENSFPRRVVKINKKFERVLGVKKGYSTLYPGMRVIFEDREDFEIIDNGNRMIFNEQ